VDNWGRLLNLQYFEVPFSFKIEAVHSFNSGTQSVDNPISHSWADMPAPMLVFDRLMCRQVCRFLCRPKLLISYNCADVPAPGRRRAR
jgi:hypothetical protein